MNNKLGLGIIAFEGTELIAQIVMEIKDLLDYVVIGFQKNSYTGERCDANDLKEVQKLKEEGIVDEVIFIETNHTDFPRVQETVKRNKLLENIKEHGCTHELIIDSDEFYSHDAFANAKKYVYDNDIEMSYCRYVNYFHDYTHYLIYPFKNGQYVPFIAKVDYNFAWQCQDFPLPSDPTRRFVRPKQISLDPSTKEPIMETYKMSDGTLKKIPKIDYLVDYHLFEWKELKMHHLSWLRADIRKKMNAWSSKSYFDNYLEIIDKSAERFETFTEENKNDGTFLLFNTPGNKIDIGTFSRQFIFPKEEYEYHKRVNNEPNPKNIKFIKTDEKFSLLNLLDICDEISKQEKFKNHQDKWSLKLKKEIDYIVFYKEDVDENKIKDILEREKDDSIIFKNDNILILSFEVIQKIRKYVHNEWNIKYNYVEAVIETMKEYCLKNNLTFEKYFKTL